MTNASAIQDILSATATALVDNVEVTDTSHLDADTSRYQSADEWAAEDFLKNVCFNTHRSISYHKKQIANVQSEAMDLERQRERDWGERQETALSRKLAYYKRLGDRLTAVTAMFDGAKAVLKADFAVDWKPHVAATPRAGTQTVALAEMDALKAELAAMMSPKDRAAKERAEAGAVPDRDDTHVA